MSSAKQSTAWPQEKTFSTRIPPIVILKGENHLYRWYQGEIPAHWTTAVSPNGWTDAVLSCAWLQINFEPHTRPSESDQWRLLILDGHDSHITWQFIQFALAHCITRTCLFRIQLIFTTFGYWSVLAICFRV